MKNLLTFLFIVLTTYSSSQVIEVTYQEEITFAYLEDKCLIEQWENDELIKAEWSHGYDIGKGAIRYIFDFNNMVVRREEKADDGKGFLFVGEWKIVYVMSSWDESTKHFSCVAMTPYGEFFYELNSFKSSGNRCLLKSHKNQFNKTIKELPGLDWNIYNVGEVSTEFGDFVINVLE
jgi:hypothetical protein